MDIEAMYDPTLPRYGTDPVQRSTYNRSFIVQSYFWLMTTSTRSDHVNLLHVVIAMNERDLAVNIAFAGLSNDEQRCGTHYEWDKQITVGLAHTFFS